ncbi:MAG TPA: 2-phospho-L-lactate guanylyltransferase [Solirubrobacteraceae bacterium]|nr:2-phospho-L-lactate guanylyltransferase [Solirubrobacteraceae bacterium]
MTTGERGPTFAILPVKRFAAAKARLVPELSAGARRALAEAMVTDVVMALRRTKAIDEVLIVTAEPAVEAIGYGYGATVLADRAEHGQSAAALIGIAHALEHGAARVVLVPGDCPALDPGELAELLDRPLLGRSVTLVPDRHGSGTNALVLVPPGVIEPAFGAGSRARHEQAAAAAGVPCQVESVPTLLLDVDTADDLAALRRLLADRHGGAAHTRGILSRLAGYERPPAAGP